MSGDLTEQLREAGCYECGTMLTEDAADRIDELEAALEQIDRKGSGESDLAEHLADIARRALDGER